MASFAEKAEKRREAYRKRVDRYREWRIKRPRPLRDLLLALASVFKWFAIAAAVAVIAYGVFRVF
tara:strand:+ start:1216 stop:1410 length:195 start_codon:yes stop_codon:yes gene_type:complete